MSYTPAPWNRKAIATLLRFARKSSGWAYEELWEDETLHMPREDDAALVAAAPEMLEALEHMRNSPEFVRFFPATQELIIETIAKAKG
jgi:hypothetical protein